MHLLDEVKAHGIKTGEAAAKVRSCILEDSSGALGMAKVYKFSP